MTGQLILGARRLRVSDLETTEITMTVTAGPVFVIPGGSREALPSGVAVKVSGEDTGGKYMVCEVSFGPREGARLHSHAWENKWIYVMQGEFLMHVNGRRHLAGPGASLLIPRETPHRFENCGAGKGRLIVMEPACDPALLAAEFMIRDNGSVHYD